MEKINKYLTTVSGNILSSYDSTLNDTANLSLYTMIVECAIFALSLLAILRLIIIVIHSLREILETFTAIGSEEIRLASDYYG
jgi:hypothetical protein